MTKTAKKAPAPVAAEEPGTALVPLETLNPAEIFVPDGTNSLLAIIQAEVEIFEADVNTEEGRKAIWHFDRKIAASKNGVDRLKKEFTESRRKEIDQINAEGKRFFDRCEELQERVSAPLVAWKAAEKARIDAHRERLDKLRALGVTAGMELSSDEVAQRQSDAAILFAGEEQAAVYDWEDFKELAGQTYSEVAAILGTLLDQALRREEQEAELARLRAEKEERDRKDREAQVAREAEEKAKADSAAAIKAESDRAARAELEAAQAKEREAQAVADAERQAQEAAERAAQAERDRQAAETRRLADEAAAREADQAHRGKINREALACIMQHAKLTEMQGIAVLTAIAKGHVKHVKISY